MPDAITIASRFNGPPKSGNGGYVCGLAASFIGGSAEVSLRAPPPLDTPLDVIRTGDGVILRHGDRDIAIARTAAPQSTPPPALTLDQAERAARSFRGRGAHNFRTCFVCGPARAEGDGLRIFAGAADQPNLSAAPWTPHADLAAADGLVAKEFLWAALDCPSFWALPGDPPCVLGRLTARIISRPAPGAPLIVTAAPLRTEGRKHHSASAVYTTDGALLAHADALWIEIDPKNFQ